MHCVMNTRIWAVIYSWYSQHRHCDAGGTPEVQNTKVVVLSGWIPSSHRRQYSGPMLRYVRVISLIIPPRVIESEGRGELSTQLVVEELR